MQYFPSQAPNKYFIKVDFAKQNVVGDLKLLKKTDVSRNSILSLLFRNEFCTIFFIYFLILRFLSHNNSIGKENLVSRHSVFHFPSTFKKLCVEWRKYK